MQIICAKTVIHELLYLALVIQTFQIYFDFLKESAYEFKIEHTQLN